MSRTTTAFVLLCAVALVVGALVSASAAVAPATGDHWPYWRGPEGTGVATEAAPLPESWSPEGDNLAWTAPYGGRSAPVVFEDRLYVQNSVGEGPEMQERVMALSADTGEVIWEHTFNVTLSDAPPHRVGWSSPTVDPQTGNIYVMGVDGTAFALSPDGERIWERLLSEEFGILSTHGGRTPSPLVVDDIVVVSGVTAGWGSLARGWHRFIGLDKRDGGVVWVSTPGTPPHDTTYAPPLLAELEGQQVILVGGGSGGVHAIQAHTGKPLWHFEMSKRGINTGVLMVDDMVIVSHGEENLEESTMGRIAAIDASGEGELGEESVIWSSMGLLAGYSSPVIEGDVYYQIDNAANLMALEVETGEVLWTHNLGTIQRASPVLADGKMYVGTANGDFYILDPSRSGVEELDHDQLSEGDAIEEIIASVAVARGRVYLVSSDRIYAIGPERARVSTEAPEGEAPMQTVSDDGSGEAGDAGTPATVLIHPQEMILEPGEAIAFQARVYDEAGDFIRVAGNEASWSASAPGTIDESGNYVAGDGPAAGLVTVTVDGVEGSARFRIIPPLPWSWDFDGLESVPSFWVGALGKFRPDTIEGDGVLVKTNDNPFLRRTKVFMGPSELSDYTVRVSFKSDLERRRLGDAGVIAQRYALILFGTKQELQLQSWQPETERTIVHEFPARPDTWYTVELRTTNLEDGAVRVQGKLWVAGEPEPEDWTIEMVDPDGERRGSPGFYADAHAEIAFDDLVVEPNR